MKRIDRIPIELRFNKSARKWKKDSEVYSLADMVWSHKDLLIIISMGEKVLPFILKDLEKTSHCNWFYALEKITGENPVKKEDEGNCDKITSSWLDWAKNKNIVF